jgi:hypothetical protein
MNTPDATPAPITLPAISVLRLAELLTELDQFLRSGALIADELVEFLRRRGRHHPGLDAYTLIDEVSFTAARYRRLTEGIDRDAAAYALAADPHDDNHRPPAIGGPDSGSRTEASR